MTFEAFEARGYWFLPSNRDQMVFGTLYYDPREATTLHLMPGLIDLDNEEQERTEPICGETTDGRLITLGDWFLKEGSSTGCVLFANTCYVGRQYENYDEIKFREIRVQCSNLDEWVCTNGFRLPKRLQPNLSIDYQLPDSIKLYESETVNASIYFTVVPPSWSFVQKHATIEQKVHLRLQFNTDLSLNSIDRDLFKFQSFISFGIGHPVVTTSMIAFSGDREFPANQVDVLFAPQTPRRQVIVPPQRMLFTLRSIGSDARDIVSKWYANTELEPITQLYTALQVTGEYLYEEPKLVSYTQALESYHRRFMNRTELPKPEHRARKRAILNSVADEYKDWLTDKLSYSNEISLKDRLDDLVSKFNGVVDIPEDFTRRVADTRNYHVHYSERLRNSVYQGIEVLQANTILSKLLSSALLSEIGFDNIQIKDMVARSM